MSEKPYLEEMEHPPPPLVHAAGAGERLLRMVR